MLSSLSWQIDTASAVDLCRRIPAWTCVLQHVSTNKDQTTRPTRAPKAGQGLIAEGRRGRMSDTLFPLVDDRQQRLLAGEAVVVSVRQGRRADPLAAWARERGLIYIGRATRGGWRNPTGTIRLSVAMRFDGMRRTCAGALTCWRASGSFAAGRSAAGVGHAPATATPCWARQCQERGLMSRSGEDLRDFGGVRSWERPSNTAGVSRCSGM